MSASLVHATTLSRSAARGLSRRFAREAAFLDHSTADEGLTAQARAAIRHTANTMRHRAREKMLDARTPRRDA